MGITRFKRYFVHNVHTFDYFAKYCVAAIEMGCPANGFIYFPLFCGVLFAGVLRNIIEFGVCNFFAYYEIKLGCLTGFLRVIIACYAEGPAFVVIFIVDLCGYGIFQSATT